jgi:hypothetical protein
MTRYDALVLLSLAGVFAAYYITIAVLFPLCNEHQLAAPTMNRDDALIWLSFAGLFAAYCATLWVFFPLRD